MFERPVPSDVAVEGEYQPPAPALPQPANRWKGAGATAIGLGLLATKFKGLLLVLLNLKWLLVGSKVLLSSFSFLASVWVYALFWGWKFGLAFALLILVHELGHVALMRAAGIPAGLPYFIPGFGAFVTMKERPASVLTEAYTALAGPVVGSLFAFLAYGYGTLTGEPFWIAVAYTGFFLNLFNLFPVLPLDGGRVVGAISPRIWIVGLVAMLCAALAFHWFNPLMLILVVLSVPQAIAAFRGRLDPRYFALSAEQRSGIAVAYFGLAGLLFFAMLATRVATPAASIH